MGSDFEFVGTKTAIFIQFQNARFGESNDFRFIAVTLMIDGAEGAQINPFCKVEMQDERSSLEIGIYSNFSILTRKYSSSGMTTNVSFPILEGTDIALYKRNRSVSKSGILKVTMSLPSSHI